MIKYIVTKFIKIYQATLSPDHGLLKYKYPYGFCKFYPSCSEYALFALQNNSFPVALWKTTLRIIKCNPFSHPGVDVSYKQNNV